MLWGNSYDRILGSRYSITILGGLQMVLTAEGVAGKIADSFLQAKWL
jgi:hypothetical protein